MRARSPQPAASSASGRSWPISPMSWPTPTASRAWSMSSVSTMSALAPTSSACPAAVQCRATPTCHNWQPLYAANSHPKKRQSCWAATIGGCLPRACLAEQRQADRGLQPRCAIAEDDVASVVARDRPGDGQAEPDAAGLPVARILEAIERREDLLHDLIGNAWPVVFDGDVDALRGPQDRHACAFAIANGIFDQVPNRPPQGVRPAPVVDGSPLDEGDGVAELGQIVAEAFHQRRQIDGAG